MARRVERSPGLDFHWKFKDFEINTVRKKYTDKKYRYDNDSDVDMRIPIELVKWQDDLCSPTGRSCFVLAWWTKTDEGDYELEFVGGRPFEHISPEEISEIWVQLRAAQRMLDEYGAAIGEVV